MRVFLVLILAIVLSGCVLESDKPLLGRSSWSPLDDDFVVAQATEAGKQYISKKGESYLATIDVGWRSHSVISPLETGDRSISFHPLKNGKRFVVEQQEPGGKGKYATYLAEMRGTMMSVWSFEPSGRLRDEILAGFRTISKKGSSYKATRGADVMGAWERISEAIDANGYRAPDIVFQTAKTGNGGETLLARGLTLLCLGQAGHGTLREQNELPAPLSDGIDLAGIKVASAKPVCEAALAAAPNETAIRIALARVYYLTGEDRAVLKTLDALPKADAGKAFLVRSGMLYAGRGGLSKGFEQVRAEGEALAAKGDVHAAYSLAYYQATVSNDPKDHAAAMRLARFAVQGGLAEANMVIGLLYRDGKGVRASASTALKHFVLSADAGHLAAQIAAAEMYYFGKGAAKDMKRAFPLAEKAAKGGSPRAQYLVGFMHMLGQGTAKAEAKAVRYFKQAHEAGVIDATAELGWMTAKGLGTKADKAAGRALLEQAAKAGSKAAKTHLAALDNPAAGGPPEYQADLTKLFQGKKIRFSQTNTPFMAGLASGVLETCSNVPYKTRVRLARFVATSTVGALVGSDYSNPNLGAAIGSQLRSQSVFAGGAVFGRNLPCGPTTNRLLSGIEASVNSLDEGPFVASCSRAHGKSKCGCLAKTARQVILNISSQRYSQSLMRQIIERNPFIALQIAMTCGISNY